MPEIRKIDPIVRSYSEFQELAIEDKEVLTRLLNVFRMVNDDLVKRWRAADPQYQWSDAAQLHRRLEAAIASIEILIE